MPALPSNVTAYLLAVKTALRQGSDLGSDIRGAAQNFLRAQDLATVLELLQAGLTTGTLTATGGTARSVQDSAGTFVIDQQVGNLAVFTGNVTATLAGVQARVVANSATELFFGDGVLPATPVAGDTYVVRGGLADDVISTLRQGRPNRGDAPPGSVYGDHRVAMKGLDAILGTTGLATATGLLTFAGNAQNAETVTIGGKVYTFETTVTAGDGHVLVGSTAAASRDNLLSAINLTPSVGGVAATGTLTFAGNAANTNTVTIDTKVYTFQTVLTNVDGNVLIGATASDSIDNLIAAITLGAGSGTLYAAATTLHPTVTAAAGAGDTMTATAKTKGAAGNSIATTETLGSGSWGAATLQNGADGYHVATTTIHPTVFGAASAGNLSIVAKQSGPEGNAIGTTETMANASFGGATLSGGARGAMAVPSMASLVTGSGSTTSSIVLNTRGAAVRIDEFRGLTMTISSQSRKIVSNDAAGVCLLDAPLTAAPGSSVALTLTAPFVSDVGSVSPVHRVHPGGQPGDNARLADLIDQAQTAVTSYTLPT